MISVNNKGRLSEIVSIIISFGINNGYSFSTIEEKIGRSFFVKELEDKVNDSFLYQYSDQEIVEKIYDRKIKDKELLKSNPLSIWLGEIFIHLFFKYNKSLSYIFLYLPLERMVGCFNLYHEMDISNVDALFENEIKKASLLKLLIKKNHLNIGKLSALTCIKENTIKSYVKNDKTIYNAKFEYIKRLSYILDVDINVFRERLNNYLTSDMYLFDKENVKYRYYLGLSIVSYFNRDIRNQNFVFDGEYLTSQTSKIKVTWTSTGKIDFLADTLDDFLNSQQNTNDILIIFDYTGNEDVHQYVSYLNRLGYKFLALISGDYYYEITSKKVIKKRISNQLAESSIQNAKRMYGEEFAI